MKKVLFVSYYFPPNAGIHVQRIAKFAKYLPTFGYEPVILTSNVKFKHQDALLAEETKHLQKYIANDLGKFIPYTARKLAPNCFTPDKLITWGNSAVQKALQIIRHEKIDLLFASAPPHSIGYIAGLIAEKSGLPFVLDFRDEWLTFPLLKQTKTYEKQRKMYNDTIHRAACVTTVNQTLQQRILEDADRNLTVNVVFNGYDESDLPLQIKTNKNKTLKICYNGRLKKIAEPSYFYKALNAIMQKKEIDSLELILMTDKKKHDLIENHSQVDTISQFIGYQTLQKSYKIIAESDIGLVLLSNYGESAAFPSKMFDYIGLQKPILAFLDKKNELADFLENYQASCVIYNNSPLEESVRKVSHFFHLVKEDKIEAIGDFKTKFTRKNQTKTLSCFFDEILKSSK